MRKGKKSLLKFDPKLDSGFAKCVLVQSKHDAKNGYSERWMHQEGFFSYRYKEHAGGYDRKNVLPY